MSLTDPKAINMRSEPMHLGDGRTVTFVMTDGTLEAEWKPRIPHGPGGAKYLPAYRRARDEFMRRVAKKTGLNVLVVDL